MQQTQKRIKMVTQHVVSNEWVPCGCLFKRKEEAHYWTKDREEWDNHER